MTAAASAACAVPTCSRTDDVRRYINGPLCTEHRPAPPPTPPTGTTAAELLERAARERREALDLERAAIPRELWAVVGTPCMLDACDAPRPHQHASAAPCAPACPCRKTPRLWRMEP